jgi:hypothetical protein
MSTPTGKGVAHPEPPNGVRQVPIPALKHAINTVRAGLVFAGMLSPAHAAYQYDSTLSASFRICRSARAQSCQNARCKERVDRPDLAGPGVLRSVISNRGGTASLKWKKSRNASDSSSSSTRAGPQADYLPRTLTRCTAALHDTAVSISDFNRTAAPASRMRLTQDPLKHASPRAWHRAQPRALQKPPGRTPPVSCATAPA